MKIDTALFDRIQRFDHAILTFIDDQGFPMSVATGFRADAKSKTLTLDLPGGAAARPRDGQLIAVAFSHIQPQQGIGYNERRYVEVKGTARLGDGTVQVTPTRAHGWDENELSFFELCERAVPTGLAYMQKLSAERGREVKPRLAWTWLFFRATRLPFLTATLVPVLLGIAVAAFQGVFDWGLALLTLLAAALVHLGLNVANDIFDHVTGADPTNVNPTPFSGGSRVIQYGLISLRGMIGLAALFYGLSAAIGLYLAWTRAFWPLVTIGVIGLFISVFYTAPPFRLVARGLGEVATALGFGPIMTLGAYYVQAQRFSWEAVYASIPVGILIALVLYVNEIADRQPDAQSGKHTLVVRLSRQAVVRGYALAASATYLLVVAGVAVGLLPWPTLLTLLSAPLAWQVYQGIQQGYESPYALMGPMAKNIQLHLATGLLLFAGYVVATVGSRLLG
ncbi:MAG: prenyltransferase [Anaerolineae bacterium]|nr:prenyltransferase [Anaerolineae bacterium]